MKNSRKILFACIGLFAVLTVGAVLWSEYGYSDKLEFDAVRHLEEQALARSSTNLVSLPPITKPIRLAIGSLGPAATAGPLNEVIISRLSAHPDFVLVERKALDQALAEFELGLGGGAGAAEAVRAGSLLKADWFLLGTGTISSGNTNAIFARIVDVKSGVIRDATVFSVDEDLIKLSVAISEFLIQAANHSTSGTRPNFIGIGSFQNVGTSRRLPEFGNQIRNHLLTTTRKRGNLVERELVDALYHELQLDASGLSQGSSNVSNRIPPQNAYWIVDGFFQSMDDPANEVELVLRIQRVFSGRRLITLKGKADLSLFAKMDEEIGRVLGDSSFQNVPAKPEREAKLQFQRGKELLGAGELYYLESAIRQLMYSSAEVNQAKAIQFEEAAKAFQQSILLNPADAEPKLWLGTIYQSGPLADIDAARALYVDVMSNYEVDSTQGRAARIRFATMEKLRNRREAQELLRSYISSSKNPEHRHAYETALESILKEDPSLAPTSRIEVAIQRRERELEALVNGTNTMSWYDLSLGQLMTYSGRKKNLEEFNRDVVPRFLTKFPTLKPHLLASAVSLQEDTNSPLVAEFKHTIREAAKTNNFQKLGENFFNSNAFNSVLWWAAEKRLFSLLDYMGETHGLAVKNGMANPPEPEKQIIWVLGWMELNKWRQALDVLEPFGTRCLMIGQVNPWSEYNEPISCAFLASICRDKLKLPAPRNSIFDRLGNGQYRDKEPFSIYKDEAGLWLITSRELKLLNQHSLSLIRSIPLRWGHHHMYHDATHRLNEGEVNGVQSTPDKLYLALPGDVFVEIDKKSGEQKRFSEDDGLKPYPVGPLVKQGNRIWIGYLGGGGIGYLDLDTGRITNFISQINIAAVESAAPRWRQLQDLKTNEPPQFKITEMAAGEDDHLWFASFENAFGKYDTKNNRWAITPTATSEEIRAFLIQDGYTIIGRREPIGNSSNPHNALTIRSQISSGEKSFSLAQGLPYHIVSKLAKNGRDLWLAGPGYVASLNLDTSRLWKVYRLQVPDVTDMFIADKTLWLAAECELWKVDLEKVKSH